MATPSPILSGVAAGGTGSLKGAPRLILSLWAWMKHPCGPLAPHPNIFPVFFAVPVISELMPLFLVSHCFLSLRIHPFIYVPGNY